MATVNIDKEKLKNILGDEYGAFMEKLSTDYYKSGDCFSVKNGCYTFKVMLVWDECNEGSLGIIDIERGEVYTSFGSAYITNPRLITKEELDDLFEEGWEKIESPLNTKTPSRVEVSSIEEMFEIKPSVVYVNGEEYEVCEHCEGDGYIPSVLLEGGFLPDESDRLTPSDFYRGWKIEVDA